MNNYFDFFSKDDSNIAIENWVDSYSVLMHRHAFYDFFIIEKGSCTHFYDDIQTLLIPGDCFLVPPEHAHGFSVHNKSSIFNCQFYEGYLSSETQSIISTLSEGGFECDGFFDSDNKVKNKMGPKIIHLDPFERDVIIKMIVSIKEEQSSQYAFKTQFMRNNLENILILFCRKILKARGEYSSHPSKNRELINSVMAMMDNNLQDGVDFSALAKSHAISVNHFRKLFKDFTGLSPVEYLNRLRIVNSCERLLNVGGSVSEIAASVGIYDANYFSRLFKHYIGCSPKQYYLNNRSKGEV